ncbi:MAG: hypothetical protein ABSH14_04545 [Verrucomicrobiia bacterium]
MALFDDDTVPQNAGLVLVYKRAHSVERNRVFDVLAGNQKA